MKMRANSTPLPYLRKSLELATKPFGETVVVTGRNPAGARARNGRNGWSLTVVYCCIPLHLRQEQRPSVVGAKIAVRVFLGQPLGISRSFLRQLVCGGADQREPDGSSLGGDHFVAQAPRQRVNVHLAGGR